MHSRIFQVGVVAALGALLTACSDGTRAAQIQNEEIAALTQLAVQATQRARSIASDAALQQLDIIWGTGRSIVRFTNAAATEEIDVEVPGVGAASTQWQATSVTVSPLANGRPRQAMNLASLEVPPSVAAQAMEQSQPGVRVYGLTLVDEGGQLVWSVFGEVAEGVLTGRVSNATGTFEPTGPGRPVQPPRAQ